MEADKLTPKQRAFVNEYLVDLNATQAAIRAGYSETAARSIACENLTKPNIAQAVADALNVRADRTAISQDWVVEKLRTITDRCMQAEPVTDRRGDPVKVQTEDGDEAVAYTFQAAPAIRSLELLGKHAGMFNKVELSGPGGGAIQVEDKTDTFETAKRIALAMRLGADAKDKAT